MHRVLGIPCPGCGATTSLALLARGRIVESATVHPFACLLAVLTALVGVLALVEHMRGRDLALRLRSLPKTKLAVGGAILWALAWAWNVARAL
jgi:hypothetical protein